MSQPFGVELPENFDTPPAGAAESSTSPEGASNAGEVTSPAPEARESRTSQESKEPQTEAAKLADLDSLERFRFQGREWTREEFQNFLSQQRQDESAKFERNFRADLAIVVADPARLADFKAVYPPEYVQIVERLLAQGKTTPAANTPADAPKPSADPRLDEVYRMVDEWKMEKKEARVQDFSRQLDTSFERLAKKYPDADPEVINSRCIALSQQGVQLQQIDAKGKPTGKLNEALIEKLFKQDNDKRVSLYEQKYRKKVEDQKQANSRARDMGTGGGVSSPAGKGPRTIKEATAALIADLEASR